MLQSKLLYHTSAVLAAAVDTCTLSHRQLRGSLPLAHLTDTLSETHRTVCIVMQGTKQKPTNEE